MSGVTWRRDGRIAKRKISRREYFWAACPSSCSLKKLCAYLTEEIARLGFAPVLSAELQKICVCLL